MICSIIKRRLQKVHLSQEFYQEFSDALQQVQEKHKSNTLNKSLMIKKICKKYLKICNQLTSESNIDQSLSALQFVKLLQLDIYEGKSYELYPIKITSHLLFVKCFDLKIAKHKGNAQGEEIKKKKRVYVQRLKLFVQQIEESFFYEYLQKDYYSNLELVLFLILRNEMDKLLENNTTYVTTTASILIQVSFIKKYVTKLFEILKSHIIELNEMLFYLENKVYELLTAKVKLIIQLFHIESQILFIQHIGQKFSDSEWLQYKKFLQDVDPQHSLNQAKVHSSKRTLDKISQGKSKQDMSLKNNNLAQQMHTEDKSFNEQDGGNYQNLSYQAIKAKFSSEQIDQIWEKYYNVLNKIPNSIDKQEIFEQVYTIINSFKEKNQKKTTTDKSDDQRHSIQKSDNSQSEDKSQGSEECDQIKSDQQETSKDESSLKKRNQRSSSVYKQRRNSQLHDFMSFVKESPSRQVFFSLFKKQNQDNNNGEKDTSENQSKVRGNLSILSKKVSNNQANKKSLSFLGNENQQAEEQPEDIESREEQQQVVQKPSGKDSAKRSNFKMIKDMNNIFKFIYDKNQENKSSQNIQINKIKDSVEFKSLLKNGKGSFTNFSQKLKSEGFRKLNAVKTPVIKILSNMKENEFQRLRRIKSTDIMGTNKTTGNSMTKKWSKEKIEKTRSKTLYFPFIQKQAEVASKSQASKMLGMEKMSSSNKSKLFISAVNNIKNSSKVQLKIKSRTESKRTTLDIMEVNRLFSKSNDSGHMTDSNKQNGFRLDNNEAIHENQQLKLAQQINPKNFVSMGNQEGSIEEEGSRQESLGDDNILENTLPE